jgi:hypothetical protein
MHYDHIVACALGDIGQWHVHHPQAALDAAYGYLASQSAGLPFVSMVDETARDDARFWSETASLPELECYTFAAIDKMRGSAFASRQVKRLLGALWRRMAPAEKTAFIKWVGDFEGWAR